VTFCIWLQLLSVVLICCTEDADKPLSFMATTDCKAPM